MRLKYYWSDFTWHYYYIPKYKLQLFWRLRKHVYCNFDISESVIEFVFEIYKHYFESCGDRLKPWIEEDGKIRERHFFAFNPDEEPSGIKFEEFKNIYDYINTYRIENKKKVDDLFDYIHEPFKSEFVKCDDSDEFYKMKVLHDHRHLNVSFSFDALGKITLITKEVEKTDNKYLYLEEELNKKDDEFAKKILDIRQSLWV